MSLLDTLADIGEKLLPEIVDLVRGKPLTAERALEVLGTDSAKLVEVVRQVAEAKAAAVLPHKQEVKDQSDSTKNAT